MTPAERFAADASLNETHPATTSSLLAEMQRLIDDPSEDGSDGQGVSEEWGHWLELLSSERQGDTTGETSDTELAEGERDSFPLRIARFELHSILGSGGFGIVFRARDPQLGRDVALKILRPEAAISPRMQRRFLREASAAAQLEHRGIISVYDVGRQAGLCYLAAPLCEGPNLAAWMREHPGELSARQAAALIAQVADAVQHAHSRGILHRDLKPSNILLKAGTSEDDLLDFQPLLTDFGLARRLDANGDETLQGMILGTTAYMSPEQAAGKWTDVGVTSDVFSLGIILYELLTGARPFGGSSPEETRQLIISAESVALRRIRPELPIDLETICLKCLAKEPHDRYGSAGELAAELKRLLRYKPILARPPSIGKHIWLWCRRRPVVAALALLLMLTLASSAAISLVLFHRERAARVSAEEHLDVARQAVSDMYTKVADEWLVHEPEVQDLRREFLEDALRFYERIVAQRPQDERSRYELSEALHRMANISANLGQREQSVELRERCLAIIDTLRREHAENKTYQYDAFMKRLLIAGERPGIGPAGRTAILLEADTILRILVQASPNNPVYRDALAALCVDRARDYFDGGEADKALELWREATTVSAALVEEFPDRPMFAKHAAKANVMLALRSAEVGKADEADELFAKAKQLIDNVRHQAPQSRWVDDWAWDVEFEYACVLANRGDMQTAIPLLEDCRDSLGRLTMWYPMTRGFRENRARVCLRLADAYAASDRIDDMSAALNEGERNCRSVLAEFTGVTPATEVLRDINARQDSLSILLPEK